MTKSLEVELDPSRFATQRSEGELMGAESGKLRVVAVDDSPSVIAHFDQLVKNLDGVEVVGTAKDGVEALALLKTTSPDLVVMDIVMPRMD